MYATAVFPSLLLIFEIVDFYLLTYFLRCVSGHVVNKRSFLIVRCRSPYSYPFLALFLIFARSLACSVLSFVCVFFFRFLCGYECVIRATPMQLDLSTSKVLATCTDTLKCALELNGNVYETHKQSQRIMMWFRNAELFLLLSWYGIINNNNNNKIVKNKVLVV